MNKYWLTTLSLIVGCGASSAHEPAPSGPPVTASTPHEETLNTASAPMEAALRAIADGTAEGTNFEFVYDDMHALYGGETLTLQGDGTLHARWQTPPTDALHEETVQLTRTQVQAIATLLVELHAWRQDVPEQTVPPDTTFSHVRIRVGSETSDVWELHEHMERLNQVQRALRAHVPGLAR